MTAPLPAPIPAAGVVCLRGDTVLLVRRGVRPSGLAPPESLTRFTWSLAGDTA
ncbi:MAG: hypothetical protein Q8O54_05475 [Brevundimonas sp.]|nr:hypothetical protein [Brevundimonas sp.]